MMDDQREMLEEQWAKLKRLILLSRTEERAPSDRPDDDSILAYLMGSASDEQISQVRAAMITSRAFRREIMQLGRTISDLKSVPDRNLEQYAAPDRVTFLHDHRRGEREATKEPATWLKFLNFKTSRIWIPLAAAAALFVVLLSQLDDRASAPEYAMWKSEPGTVEKSLLISMSSRALEPDKAPQIFPTAKEAAFSGFKSALQFDLDNNQFLLLPVEQDSPTSAGQVRYTITLKDTGDTLDTTLVLLVPVKSPAQDMLWMLRLPSLSLASTAAEDTIHIDLEQFADDDILLVVTYPLSDGYAASSVQYRRSRKH